MLQDAVNLARRQRQDKAIINLVSRRPLLEYEVTWACENIVRDWTNKVFTDESSFWAQVPRSKAWSTRTNRIVEQTVEHAVKVYVWGCFNVRGFRTLRVFTGNLNAQRMVQLDKKRTTDIFKGLA
ncbi:hypothetical protein Trydic_g16997 [Trypoxylus dichotomus]